MSTEFEFFEGTATVNSTTPRVTVRKAGQLVLTEAAVAMLGEGVEAVQIGYNPKSRVVGIRPAAEGVRGALKLRAQPNGRSRLVDAKRFFAHRGLALGKARGLEVEDFGGGIIGFRLPEEGAGEAEAPAQVKTAKGGGGRRKASAG
jgi:hypothetical protein